MKTYYLQFGSGDPANFTGLTPTFTIFSANGVTSLPPPGITETPVGSGLYSFLYGPTLSILFKVDGGAGLAEGDRYISNALDPVQAVDEQIGYATDSIGTTGTDPSTIFGYVKRNREFLEGDQVFTKQNGIWQAYSRGASVLLMEKTLENNVTETTRT